MSYLVILELPLQYPRKWVKSARPLWYLLYKIKIFAQKYIAHNLSSNEQNHLNFGTEYFFHVPQLL